MAVAVFVMHFPVAEEVGKQDWRMRCWPGVFESILETWEAAQEGGSRGAAEIVDAASRGLVLSAKLMFADFCGCMEPGEVGVVGAHRQQ